SDDDGQWRPSGASSQLSAASTSYFRSGNEPFVSLNGRRLRSSFTTLRAVFSLAPRSDAILDPMDRWGYRTACFGTILTISELPEAFYGVVDCGARHRLAISEFGTSSRCKAMTAPRFSLELIFG
ncbi:hypothetical protein ANCCAN_19660, partial [Ancylostoma caninum]